MAGIISQSAAVSSNAMVGVTRVLTAIAMQPREGSGRSYVYMTYTLFITRTGYITILPSNSHKNWTHTNSAC